MQYSNASSLPAGSPSAGIVSGWGRWEERSVLRYVHSHTSAELLRVACQAQGFAALHFLCASFSIAYAVLKPYDLLAPARLAGCRPMKQQ